MADYDLLGSFATGGAADLNADLINKLKDADKQSVLFQIDKDLEALTGLDAETGEELDRLGELDTLLNIQIQTMDLMSRVSVFDLSSTEATAFDQVVANTTGSAAVFDALDVSGLEPGTTNIEVTQLAQRDVYQSLIITESEKNDATIPIISADANADGDSDDAEDATLAGSSKISVTIDGETFDYTIANNPDAASVAEMTFKTFDELAAEINENEKLIASMEEVGSGEYRLVIKSSDSGLDNAMTITQTNVNIGFGETQQSSSKIDDSTALVDGGQGGGDEIVVNGVSFSTVGKTYDQLVSDINDYDGDLDLDGDPLTNPSDTFNASIVDGQIVITADDGSDITIDQTLVDIGFYDSTGQTQVAQNLVANVDGIDYDVSSNTMTIQGNLTMTAVELGKSTIDIQRDTTAIYSSLESFTTSYNALVDMVQDELSDSESNISDSSALRDILGSIKEKLFQSYGPNGDLNLFSHGLDIDLQGHLSIDSEKFADSIADHYDDIQKLLMGNTTDADLASSDSTKYLGLGYSLKSYLDGLDDSDGALDRYTTQLTARQEELNKEREKALESLDLKYDTMSKQFSDYAGVITQMESAFSGLKMMIDQSVAGK